MEEGAKKYTIANRTPSQVLGMLRAEQLGYVCGHAAIDDLQGIFVNNICKLGGTPICALVLMHEESDTLVALAELDTQSEYIDPIPGTPVHFGMRGILWERIPAPTHPDIEPLQTWLDNLDQEARLTRIERVELLVVRDWPSARRQGLRQDDYCAQEGISTDSLRNWRKKYHEMGFDTGW